MLTSHATTTNSEIRTMNHDKNGLYMVHLPDTSKTLDEKTVYGGVAASDFTGRSSFAPNLQMSAFLKFPSKRDLGGSYENP